MWTYPGLASDQVATHAVVTTSSSFSGTSISSSYIGKHPLSVIPYSLTVTTLDGRSRITPDITFVIY